MSRPLVEPPPTATDQLATVLVPLGLVVGAVRLQVADRAGRRDPVATAILTATAAGALAMSAQKAWLRYRSRAETHEILEDPDTVGAIAQGRAAVAEGDYLEGPELDAFLQDLLARSQVS